MHATSEQRLISSELTTKRSLGLLLRGATCDRACEDPSGRTLARALSRLDVSSLVGRVRPTWDEPWARARIAIWIVWTLDDELILRASDDQRTAMVGRVAGRAQQRQVRCVVPASIFAMGQVMHFDAARGPAAGDAAVTTIPVPDVADHRGWDGLRGAGRGVAVDRSDVDRIAASAFESRRFDRHRHTTTVLPGLIALLAHGDRRDLILRADPGLGGSRW